MALYSPRASGLGNSAAYQVSGRPFVTGSTVETAGEVKIEFPTVTKAITFGVTGSATLRFHFDSVASAPALGTAFNFVPVYPTTADANHTFRMEVKCKEIYVSGVGAGQSGFVLLAELTGIPASEMYELSGSGINI